MEEMVNFFCKIDCYSCGMHRYDVFAFIQCERTLRNVCSVTLSEQSDLIFKRTQRKSNVQWFLTDLRYNATCSRCCTSSLHQQQESIPVECVSPAFPIRGSAQPLSQEADLSL